MKRVAVLLAFIAPLFLAVGACAPIPPPQVVLEADQLSKSPAVREAKELAAPAWERAEKRRLEAHEALDKGPQAHAQFLGEESIALFQEAVALARLAKATLREKAAAGDQEALEKQLFDLDAEQARASADVDALEARLRTARAVGPGAPQGPEGEAGRRDAARSFIVQAKLLCVSARILGAGATSPAPGASPPDDPTSPAALSRDLAAAEAQITALEADLADTKKPAAADAAAKVRADCSSVLGRTRRSGTAKAASGAADALLEEVSAMAARSKGLSLDPARDERGVVVTIRNAFDQDALTQGARDRVAELDRVAAAHKTFPVAVVVHTDRTLSAAERAKWESRGNAIASAFGSVEAKKKVVIVAGDAVPIASRSSAERAGNARVEIVFIAPEAL